MTLLFQLWISNILFWDYKKSWLHNSPLLFYSKEFSTIKKKVINVSSFLKKGMEPENSANRKRITTAILIGIILLILSAGIYSMAILMVSVMVMGCTKSPPEWVYLIVFIGLPVPLIITTILVPYFYTQKKSAVWMIFTPLVGLSFCCMIFLLWFLILTQYCWTIIAEKYFL